MSALSGVAGSVMALIIVRIIMGIAEGPVASTGVAVAVEASKPARRGLNNGIFQCMISLFGLALAPLIATRLLNDHSWHVVFMLVGAPGIIVAVIMWFVVREPLKRANTGHGTGGAPFMSMFAHRNAKVAPLTLICAMGGIFVIAAMLTAYLTAPAGAGLGLDPVTAGNVFSAVGIGGCIGQFAMPALSDVIGRKVSTLASYILAAVSLYFFTQAGPDNTTMLWVLLFFASLFNFAALAILAGPVAAEAAPPGMLASMAGFVIFAGEFVGGGIAPIIAGGLASNPAYGLKGGAVFRGLGPRGGFRGRAVPQGNCAAQDRPRVELRLAAAHVAAASLALVPLHLLRRRLGVCRAQPAASVAAHTLASLTRPADQRAEGWPVGIVLKATTLHRRAASIWVRSTTECASAACRRRARCGSAISSPPAPSASSPWTIAPWPTTFRCGSSLINESSTVDKIVEKCGVPHSKSSRTEDIRMRLPNGTMRTTGTTTTEEWTYERGTTAPPFVVTIVDGKVKSVNVVRR